MDANNIVMDIGKGYLMALEANKYLLGFEKYQITNADIRPEYVATVNIGRALVKPDASVTLEAQMRCVRNRALAVAKMNYAKHKNLSSWVAVQRIRYNFYHILSKRVDILVTPSTGFEPHLMVEIKLGIKNSDGVCNDIDRIVRLLNLFQISGRAYNHKIYGAVTFHIMQEGVDECDVEVKLEKIVSKIKDCIMSLRKKHSWLKCKFGRIDNAYILGKARTCLEDYGIGKIEEVMAADKYIFEPIIILLGSTNDIESAGGIVAFDN